MEQISREKGAELIISPQAPVRATWIRYFFREEGLTPPKDFVITPFDTLVLSIVNMKIGVKTDEICKEVQDAFARLGHSVTVGKSEIHFYFRVLRGKFFWKTEKGSGAVERPTSKSFPEIRDRYNAACVLKRGIFPHIKTDIQYLFASFLVEGMTAAEIMDECKVSCCCAPIVDLMIVDLYEKHVEELKAAMLRSIDEIDTSGKYPDFRTAIERGQFLHKVPESYQLRRGMNQAVSALWLDKYRQDCEQFYVENLRYAMNAVAEFVRGPSVSSTVSLRGRHGRAMAHVNKWFRTGYQDLEPFRNFGAFIVKFSLGLDYYNLPIVNILDEGVSFLRVPKSILLSSSVQKLLRE